MEAERWKAEDLNSVLWLTKSLRYLLQFQGNMPSVTQNKNHLGMTNASVAKAFAFRDGTLAAIHSRVKIIGELLILIQCLNEIFSVL